jgi:hypothetical protein
MNLLSRLSGALRAVSLCVPVMSALSTGCSTTHNGAPAPRIWRDETGRCWSQEAVACHDAPCAAPPPLRVECPADGAVLEPAGWKSQLGRIEDAPASIEDAPASKAWRDEAGRCWAVSDFKCPPPEIATCSPPPPRGPPESVESARWLDDEPSAPDDDATQPADFG